jgi:hypothetical protein
MDKLRNTTVMRRVVSPGEEPYTAEIQDAVIELGELYDGFPVDAG